MTRQEIEADLAKKLPVHSIGEMNDLPHLSFPYTTYDELLGAYQKGKVAIKVQYDNRFLRAVGKTSEVIAHHLLTSIPFLIMIIPLILAFAFRNYWMLAGIPLAAVGFFLATVPGTMKIVGNTLLVLMLLLFAVAVFKKNATIAYLAAFYCLASGFTLLARHQCAWIIRREALKSELIFIALYLDSKILVQPIASDASDCRGIGGSAVS